MGDNWVYFLEFLGLAGGALGFCVYQLWSLKKLEKARLAKRGAQSPESTSQHT